jgi:hypothetical protein
MIAVGDIEVNDVAILLEHAINDAWFGSQDKESAGCCPQCCGPCSVIKRLRESGQLDDILRDRLRGKSYWWDDTTDRGDWGFLDQHWRMTICHAEES